MTVKDLRDIHDYLEDMEVCFKGVRDENLLESSIFGSQWYDDEDDKIIHTAYSVCANHIFNDGNKRSTFLILMIYEDIEDPVRLSEIILDLASSNLDKESFFKEIKSILRNKTNTNVLSTTNLFE